VPRGRTRCTTISFASTSRVKRTRQSPDANSQLRAAGESANVEGGISGHDSIVDAQHAISDVRVEGAQVSSSAGREGNAH
jgi:hypothetical protein